LHEIFQTWVFFVGNVGVLKGVVLIANVYAAIFRQDVLADRMHIRPETFRVVNAAGEDRQPYAAKSLLAYVFNCMGVDAAGAKRYFQALTEVRDEMCLRGWISGPQAPEVFFIERVKVHWLFQPVYFSFRRRFPFSGPG